MNNDDLSAVEVQRLFSRVLKKPVVFAEKLRGGRNTQVYCLRSEDGGWYAGKRYFRHPTDTRDRLGTEFAALRFLWENGVRSIPKPMAADESVAVAVYEFIQGRRIHPEDISDWHIGRVVDFVATTAYLRDVRGSDQLPRASHAIFSFQGYVDYITTRLKRLQEITRSDAPYQELRRFLKEEFQRRFAEIFWWCREQVGSDAELSREIALWQQTLSPSDFGFHNALLTRDRDIVFLDFEYFGWDDPAKMICDFLLHPAMGLSQSLGKLFFKGVLTVFSRDRGLEKRVQIMYPLAGLAWCLIFLNELLPEHAERRQFCLGKELDLATVQWEQLAKSERMLERIAHEFRDFPYRVQG